MERAFFYAFEMEKCMNQLIWGFLATLALALALMVYASTQPHLLVKIMGKYGQPGELDKIFVLAENMNSKILIIENIDRNAAADLEIGPGISLQVKRLTLLQTESLGMKQTGIPIKSRILGCSPKTIWVFMEQKGLFGLDNFGVMKWQFKDLFRNQSVLLRQFDNRSEACDFDEMNQRLTLIDKTGVYWAFDEVNVMWRKTILRPTKIPDFPIFQDRIQGLAKLTLKTLDKDGERMCLPTHPNKIYWSAGFLFDTQNNKPIVLNKSEYLLYHRQNPYNEGFVLSCISENGIIQWQKHSQTWLKEKDAQIKWVKMLKNKLFVLADTYNGLRMIVLHPVNGKKLEIFPL